MFKALSIFVYPILLPVIYPRDGKERSFLKKRTALADRKLPGFTRGEEIFNMVSHIVGTALGITATVLCVIRAAANGNGYGVVSSAIYGSTMILLYTMSSIYHGLTNEKAKKVFQVLDRCTIYFLIAGSYTPIALSAIRKVDPALGWAIFGMEWGTAAFAIVFTAIDFKKYAVLSNACYILMGWALILFPSAAKQALTDEGFLMILIGGIVYSVGAIFFAVGSKKKYMHNVFHVFVVIGSLLQFFPILFHAVQ